MKQGLRRWHSISSRFKRDIQQTTENTRMVRTVWDKPNPQKSGNLRILNIAGKEKEVENIANIPEVNEYKYLGITINLSLIFKEIVKLINKK